MEQIWANRHCYTTEKQNTKTNLQRLLLTIGISCCSSSAAAAAAAAYFRCIDPFARDRKYENFTRLFFFPHTSHVTDFAKDNRLETFLTMRRHTVVGPPLPLPACMFNFPDKKKQPSGLFIGSKSLKMANSWHEAALNIKCRGGRCDSQHYTIRLQPLDKLQTSLLMQNASLQTRQETFMFQQLNHMFRVAFFFPFFLFFKTAHIYSETPYISSRLQASVVFQWGNKEL